MTETTMPRPEPVRRARGGLVGPVALIAAGAALLLNNLGVLSWDLWGAFVRLWPVLLIGAGLDLIVGRRSAVVSLAIGLATVVAFAVGAVYLGASPAALVAASSQAIDYQLGGARSADVSLAINAGELRVGAAEERGALAAGTVHLRRGETLLREHSVSDGAALLKLQARSQPNVDVRPDNTPPWELALSREVPLALNVSAGAGHTVLDLSRLQITSLNVSAGVGQTELTLPERGRITANLSAGVGETVVRIPAGMAARIHASGGLSDIDVDGRFTREGDYYTSPGYETAQNRVELDISNGIGQLRVETLPAR